MPIDEYGYLSSAMMYFIFKQFIIYAQSYSPHTPGKVLGIFIDCR